MPTIDDRFLLRGGLKAALTSLNEVPLRREMIIELDNLFTTGEFKAKIGDGVTHYNALPYLQAGGSTYTAGAGIDIDDSNPEAPIISSTLGSIAVDDKVADYASLPSPPPSGKDSYYVVDQNKVYIWNGSSWFPDGEGIDFSQSFESYDSSQGDVAPLSEASPVITKVNGIYNILSATPLTIGDPYWSNVAALLYMEGADNSTTFVDEILANTWTAEGTAKIVTAQHKYGTSSATQTGGISRISAPYSEALAIGTTSGKPFTVETWLKLGVALSGEQWILGAYNYESNRRSFRCGFNGGSIAFQPGSGGSGDSTVSASAAAFADGGWHHLAFTRDASSVLRIFVDGIMLRSASVRAAFYKNTVDGISIYAQCPNVAGPGGLTGSWLSNFRITNGVARYIADFQPPLRKFYNYSS